MTIDKSPAWFRTTLPNVELVTLSSALIFAIYRRYYERPGVEHVLPTIDEITDPLALLFQANEVGEAGQNNEESRLGAFFDALLLEARNQRVRFWGTPGDEVASLTPDQFGPSQIPIPVGYFVARRQFDLEGSSIGYVADYGDPEMISAQEDDVADAMRIGGNASIIDWHGVTVARDEFIGWLKHYLNSPTWPGKSQTSPRPDDATIISKFIAEAGPSGLLTDARAQELFPTLPKETRKALMNAAGVRAPRGRPKKLG